MYRILKRVIFVLQKKNNIKKKKYTIEEFSEVGLFHQWINSSEECNGGVITYVVAIVEKLNGEILELPSNAVRFTDTSFFS